MNCLALSNLLKNSITRMTVKENIENLYETFKKYKLNGKIDKCPCGCISNEEEQKLYSKSLKELEAEDIGLYCGKAMTTWGNEDDYKHFLPRIIEIYKNDKWNGWIDLDTIHSKLMYGNWKDWEIEEQKQINKFVEIDWQEFVNKSESTIGIMDLESYLKYIALNELLKNWDFPRSKIALRNFVEFFYLNGNEILYSDKTIKINGESMKRELTKLLERDSLAKKLEEQFFESEGINPEYANKISIVLQIVENELNKKTNQ